MAPCGAQPLDPFTTGGLLRTDNRAVGSAGKTCSLETGWTEAFYKPGQSMKVD